MNSYKMSGIVSMIAGLILSAPGSYASETDAVWAEPVRLNALAMIDDAIAMKPDARELPLMRERLLHSKLKETDQFYAHANPFSQKIYLHPVLKDALLPVQSFVLLHETVHLLFFGECEAEAMAANVAENSLRSEGMAMFGYLSECRPLKEQICGMPVYLEWNEQPFDLNHSSRKEIQKRIKHLGDYGSQVTLPIFAVDRLKNWMGGSGVCSRQFDEDLNENFKRTYADMFAQKPKENIIQYFKDKRQPQIELLKLRLIHPN